MECEGVELDRNVFSLLPGKNFIFYLFAGFFYYLFFFIIIIIQARNKMPIPNRMGHTGRFIIARIKDEVFAVRARIDCTSQINQAVARELGLSFRSRYASVVIEAENKIVTMVIAISPNSEPELVLGTDFLYLLDYWS